MPAITDTHETTEALAFQIATCSMEMWPADVPAITRFDVKLINRGAQDLAEKCASACR